MKGKPKGYMSAGKKKQPAEPRRPKMIVQSAKMIVQSAKRKKKMKPAHSYESDLDEFEPKMRKFNNP